MERKRKIGILLFAALCSCFILASCGEKPVVTEPAETADTTEEGETLGVPMTADYGGETFEILSAGNIVYEDFTADESAALPLDIAQYKRKKRVEQNYNIQIHESTKQAYSSGGGPGFLAVSNAVNAGDCPYDLALIAGYDVTVLSYGGYLYDMRQVPGIDLTKSWWDQKANETLSVGDCTFFTTGDITFSDNDAAFVIMFNKQILADYGLANPYEMVYNDEWTLDNFASLCKTVTEDLNQDGEMNEEDRYGLLVWVDSLLGMVNAAGQRCCTTVDGKLTLSLFNETTVSAVEKYLAFALDKSYALQYQSIRNSAEFEQWLWSGNHGLFWTTTMRSVPSFREMESDFGLLPYPKLTATQKDYYATVAPFNSQFICVPMVQNDLERTGVLAEALAYYGQKDVLSAYYDVSLKGLNSRDEESSDMLDIIFANLVYDVGYLYQIGPYNKNFNYMVSRGDTNFVTMYESLYNVASAQLDRINDAYAKLLVKWQPQA